MSKALSAGVVSAWLAASASLWAADVWQSKPFHAWTDKELEKVLTSSPWAGKGSITYVQTRPQPIQDEATVTWLSARVMRQALARRDFGPTPEIPRRAQEIIAQTPSVYILTVKISKGPASASHAGRAEAMLNETFLQLRGKPPIPASQADGEMVGQDGKPLAAVEEPAFRLDAFSTGRPMVLSSAAQRGGGGGGGVGGGGGAGGGTGSGGQRGGGTGRGDGRGRGARGAFGPVSGASSLLTFRFPRDPITLDDKEVEFVTKLCGGGGGGPSPIPDFLQLNSAAAAQRGVGGGGFPGDPGGIVPSQSAPQGPACNYIVKKKFKLKDMLVNGELLL